VAQLRRELARRHERLERELAVARRIQFGLIPQQLPACTGWRMASAYQPAREIGGDFLDAFELPDRPGCLALHLGDVTGKGIPAALMMAFCRAVLRSATYNGTGPADTLERANRVLTTDVRAGVFVTAVAVDLEPSGRLRWASAGHEPPFLVRAGGTDPIELDPAGAMLGLLPRLGGGEQTEELAPGDRLVLWTDGVTDAQRADDERFGDARFRRLLAAPHPPGEPERVVAAILTELAAWSRDHEPSDDITLVVIERTG
jgi:sigma-B regulation protein RsbU (phosphoserine phosphatase)